MNADWPPPDVRTSVCEVCKTNIFWQEAPTGGWWIHQHHPEDGHDALPDLSAPIATLTSAVRSPAVLVIEIDPERIPEACEHFQRLAGFVKRVGGLDDHLFGPTLHVAVEDVAQAVLKHFEESPLIDQTDGS